MLYTNITNIHYTKTKGKEVKQIYFLLSLFYLFRNIVTYYTTIYKSPSIIRTKMELDLIDQRIISDLEKNARMPFLQIAKHLNVSEGTIRKRVSKLKDNGMIRKFTIELKKNYIAIVGIETNPRVPTLQVAEELKNLKCKRLFEVTGRYDLICFLSGKDLESVNETLERIRIIEGVVHTETFTILKEN